MTVAFRNVGKVFPDGTVALHDLNLEFDQGEFVVLLGPSGSGKTTACRILAGLEQATTGSVEVDGHDVTSRPPRERGMSMVFQNYALYAHKSVYENIAYPLRVRKVASGRIQGMVEAVADILRIRELLDRRPRQLSGGQAQRVAVARALVWDPQICLMDEPLSNLDALLRLHTRTELKRLHRELGKTFVFVTHDQEEAMTLGTRIAVLNEGRLVQCAPPREIYRRPAHRFVAEFIGRPAMNTIDGLVTDGRFRSGDIDVPAPDLPPGPAVLGIRPEHLQILDGPTEDSIALTLDVCELVEPDTLLFLRSGTVSLIARVMRDLGDLQPGQPIHAALPPQSLHAFDPQTGLRVDARRTDGD